MLCACRINIHAAFQWLVVLLMNFGGAFSRPLAGKFCAAAVITSSLKFCVEHTMVNVLRLAIVLLLLAGCGLKGPLTLPEPNSATNKEEKK